MLIIFISIIFLFNSCASPQQAANNEFYLGLTEHDNSHKIKLFETALSSPNEYVRRAAAEELALLISHGSELSSGTMRLVRKEARGFWADAFEAVSNFNKEKVLSFLTSYDLNTSSFHDARQYVLSECEKKQIYFTESEYAAVEGYYAVSRSKFNDALNFFRGFQTDGPAGKKIWPDQIPELFIAYPVLINSMGRAFLNTQTGNEGVDLFIKWEKELAKKNTDALFNDHRYRLLYFAGRIVRNRGGQIDQGISLFKQALPLVPNTEQLDIIIWNILEMTANKTADNLIECLEQFIPEWHNGNFFNDILERFLQRLAAAQDWNRIIRAFNLIKNTDADVSKAAYAWIIARAVNENYLSEENKRLAAKSVNAESADPVIFARIAYHASGSISIPSLYYRSLSAAVLKMPFLIFSEPERAPVNDQVNAQKEKNNSKQTNTNGQAPEDAQSPALEFLAGFFTNGAANLANHYIRSLEKELSPVELRALAQAYHDIGMYNQAMRLVALYINKESYTRERLDLELLFPRPFLELIEIHAGEFRIEPPLLLGLIRAESAFQSSVVSRAGAIGLTQLMPATAKEMTDRIRRSDRLDHPGLSNTLDLSNPDLNIYIGSFYYNYLMGLFNNAQLALMAYNGGMNRVRRWQRANPRLPADLIVETANIYETRDYGRRIIGFAAVYQELYY